MLLDNNVKHAYRVTLASCIHNGLWIRSRKIQPIVSVQKQMARFQILSLDGGGIRGLYSAAVLAKIEEKHQVSIVDHFDLITGTSTGGIIAIGLGLRMRPRELGAFTSRPVREFSATGSVGATGVIGGPKISERPTPRCPQPR